jgi:hypothetical protein
MTGHCLRVLIINQLKVKSVTGLEIAQAVRHSSVNSQMNYDRQTTAGSQINKQLALRPSVGASSIPKIAKPCPPIADTVLPYAGVAAAPNSDAAMAIELARQQAKVKELELELAMARQKRKHKKKLHHQMHFPPVHASAPHHYYGHPHFPPPLLPGYPPMPYGGGYPMPQQFHGGGGGYHPSPYGFPPLPFSGYPMPPSNQFEESDDEASVASANGEYFAGYSYKKQH